MPGPVTITVTAHAPAATVWGIITDIENSPNVVRGITKVERLDGSPGFGVGYRWRETRSMFGKTATEDMTVTNVDPGRSYLTEADNHGAHYETTMSVTPITQDSCELTMRFAATADGFLNKTLGAVMGKLMEGSVRKMVKQDLTDLVAAAERAGDAG
ncbi:MAG: hypothetical protein QG597_1479 [Actinomycetota bacterium]|nr:hypothetical protein [Actinomycetota bacterium]